MRSVPTIEIIKSAARIANIGRQIDGYRAVDGDGKVVGSFLVHEPEESYDDAMAQALSREERPTIYRFGDCVVPKRLGSRLLHWMNEGDYALSELILAGLLDRREIRRRQLPGVRIDAMKDGVYELTVASLT